MDGDGARRPARRATVPQPRQRHDDLAVAHLAPDYLVEQSRILDRAVPAESVESLPVPTQLKAVQARMLGEGVKALKPPEDSET